MDIQGNDMLKLIDINSLSNNEVNSLYMEAADVKTDFKIPFGIKVIGHTFVSLNKMTYKLNKFITSAVSSVENKKVSTWAKSMVSSCESIEKIGNIKPSKSLGVVKRLIDVAGTSVRTHAVDKPASHIVTGATCMSLVEATGIIAEALVELTTGKVDSVDQYVASNTVYKNFFAEMNDLVGESKVSKVQTLLYKESDSMDYLHLGDTEAKAMELFMETESTVPLSRILKAQLLKPLYAIMSAIRFIIYLFYYSKYTVDDRLKQIKETIDSYDNGSLSTRKEKLDELENYAQTARVDRIKSNSQGGSQMESDRVDATKAAKTDDSIEF